MGCSTQRRLRPFEEIVSMLEEHEVSPPAEPEPARKLRDRVSWWLIPLGAAIIAGAFVVGVMLGNPPGHIRVVRATGPQFSPLPGMRLTTGLPARPAQPPAYQRPSSDTNIDIVPDSGIQIAPNADRSGMNRLIPPGFTRPAPMPSSDPTLGARMQPQPTPQDDRRSDDIATGGRSEPDSPVLFDRAPRVPLAGGSPDSIDSRPQQPGRVDAGERALPSAPSANRRGAARPPAPSDEDASRRYRQFFDENDFQDER
jgi:hypothetical protein